MKYFNSLAFVLLTFVLGFSAFAYNENSIDSSGEGKELSLYTLECKDASGEEIIKAVSRDSDYSKFAFKVLEKEHFFRQIYSTVGLSLKGKVLFIQMRSAAGNTVQLNVPQIKELTSDENWDTGVNGYSDATAQFTGASPVLLSCFYNLNRKG